MKMKRQVKKKKKKVSRNRNKRTECNASKRVGLVAFERDADLTFLEGDQQNPSEICSLYVYINI